MERWICRGCCRARKTNPYLGKIGRCPLQAIGLIKAALLPELGHNLAAVSLAKGVLAFCRACGCYTQHRVRALSLPCPGWRHTGQAKALRGGRHPTTKEPFAGRPWKLWVRPQCKATLPLLDLEEEAHNWHQEEQSPDNLAGNLEDQAWDCEQEAADFLQQE